MGLAEIAVISGRFLSLMVEMWVRRYETITFINPLSPPYTRRC